VPTCNKWSSYLTTGRIATAYGRFNGISQVAPVCTPPKTCFLGPIRFLNPNGISIGSAAFAQLTAERPYILHGPSFHPLKLPLPTGICTLSNTWFLGPTPSPQPKQHLNWFSCFCMAHYCDRPTVVMVMQPNTDPSAAYCYYSETVLLMLSLLVEALTVY